MADETPVTAEGAVQVPEPTPEVPQVAQIPQTARPKSDEPPRLVKINGGKRNVDEYGERGLKHGIIYFLDELLAGNFDDVETPCISFGPITLQLRRDSCKYVMYGDPTGELVPRVRIPAMELCSSSRMNELEHNLRKFALNRNWHMLVVNFNLGRQLRIWKRPHGYGIAAVSLPAMESAW